MSEKLEVMSGVRFLPRDAMHKRGLCRHAVFVCVSVCPCVCHVRVAKPFQYFRAKRDGDIPTGTRRMQVGQAKNAILDEYLASLHTGLHCCQPYESRSVKNKAAMDGGERRAHCGVRRPLFAQDDHEVFVTGSTLYAGDESQPAPGRTQPLGHNHVFGCRRTSQDRTLRVFLLKTDTTRTPDPIRPTIWIMTPTDPRTVANKWGYDLGVFVRGVGWSETAEQNLIEFYAPVNLQPQ